MERIKVKFTGSNPNRGYGFYHPGDIGYIDGYAGDLAIVIKEDGSIVKAELGHISVVKECDSVCNKTVSESEDEKIRKELIQYIEDYPNLPNGRYSRIDFLSWLKKQGEHNATDDAPANEDKVRKKVKEIFDSCEKQDISDCEKNRVAFGLLELEAFADTFFKMGKEQKPVEWSEEDRIMIKRLEWIFTEISKGSDSFYGNNVQPIIDWLKSIKDRCLPQQQQEWSEEDEDNYIDTCTAISNIHSSETSGKLKNWLKSLRPQPKQEWSEEDEKRLNNLIDWFDGVEVGLDSTIKEDYGNWLKSLRPHKQWKPSEEQIRSLARATNRCVSVDDAKILLTLLSDIERLKAL